MGKITRIITISVLVFLASTFALAFKVEAMGGFSVTPIFPNNQNRQSGFFDIRVVPGTRQELAIDIANPGEEDITVEISLITASTNRGGVVEYSAQGLHDESMLHVLSDMTTIPDLDESREMIIPAESNVIVPIFIDIPEEGFDGIILGSIHVLLGITEEERAAAGMIVNRFANVVVIRLEDRGIITDTEFLLGDVRADIVNHRPAVVMEIRNPLARLTMGATATAHIYAEGDNEPIFVRGNVNVDFAPNSIFPFSVTDRIGYGLEPGNYLARVWIEHQGEMWEFERAFDILPQQAEEINIAAVNVQEQRPMGDQRSPGNTGAGLGGNLSVLIMAAIGVGAILVIAIASFLIVKSMTASRRNKDKEPKSLGINNDDMDYMRHVEQQQPQYTERQQEPQRDDYEQYDRQPPPPPPQREAYEQYDRQPPPQPQREAYEQYDRQPLPQPQREAYEQYDRQPPTPQPQREAYEQYDRQPPPQPQKEAYEQYDRQPPPPPQREAYEQYDRQPSPQPQREAYEQYDRQLSSPQKKTYEPHELNQPVEPEDLYELNQPMEPEDLYELNQPIDPREVTRKPSSNLHNEHDAALDKARAIEQQREKEEMRRFIMEQRNRKD